MTLYQSARNILDQLDLVISQLSDQQYRQPIHLLGDSSIGQHVRHSLEFFICLIESRNEGVVNYDRRKRDIHIEEELTSARNILTSIKTFFSSTSTDFPILLNACYDLNGDDTVSIPSTFYRELAFNIEHTIHHMALIKVGVKAAFDQIVLPEHFGIASSTVRYRNQVKTE